MVVCILSGNMNMAIAMLIALTLFARSGSAVADTSVGRVLLVASNSNISIMEPLNWQPTRGYVSGESAPELSPGVIRGLLARQGCSQGFAECSDSAGKCCPTEGACCAGGGEFYPSHIATMYID